MDPLANLLLVDDEPRNLDALVAILEQPGHRLVRAGSAQEALLALLHDDFAAIVLDVQMPDMGGFELANLIKQRDRTQHVPIIFLTAFHQDEERMLQGYKVGAVDFLTKPVNPNVLRSKVAVFVDLFRKSAELRKTNARLEKEIVQRQKAEAALRGANDELESRVQARTAALSRARDAAEQAGRTKDEFLAALSHELRTPLNPVLLLASESENNPSFSAEAREQFAAIRRNVELEARLIDDLLDLTRISRGKLPIDLKRRELHAILDDAIAMVESDIRDKALILNRRWEATSSWVMADNVRLQQVFWNLLKNAVKFTPKGGVVTVSTANPIGSRGIVVEIADTGIGLTPAEISRVFEAFSQGDHAAGGGSHQFGGLGLGLTISRGLVEHHGGRLTVRSDGPGFGSVFRMELPLSMAHGRETVEKMSSPPQPAGDDVPESTEILLVEDHDQTRKALELLLRRRGYHVTSAGSLAEARALATAQNFDLLISDIGLPDGSGCDLMRELLRIRRLHGIALTGYGMEEDVERTRAAGFSTHLTKPISVRALEAALHDALRANPTAAAVP